MSVNLKHPIVRILSLSATGPLRAIEAEKLPQLRHNLALNVNSSPMGDGAVIRLDVGLDGYFSDFPKERLFRAEVSVAAHFALAAEQLQGPQSLTLLAPAADYLYAYSRSIVAGLLRDTGGPEFLLPTVDWMKVLPPPGAEVAPAAGGSLH